MAQKARRTAPLKPYLVPIVLVCLSLFSGCGSGSLGPGVGGPSRGPSRSLVSIAITPANAALLLGTLQQFTATGTYSDHSSQDITDSVTWSSSDISVASIAGGGLATALTLGSVTISATSGSVSGSTTVNVQSAVLSSITVRPVNNKIAPFTSQQFQAIGTYTDGSTHNVTGQVSWTSSNTAVATIGGSGRAKALIPGPTTITATLGSISGSSTLDVSNATIVSISVTPSRRTIAPGTRLTFTATGVFSDHTTQVITRDCTWASDNHAVATVGAGGTATAIGPGTANISATFNGVSGMAPLNVSSATLSSISVTPASAVLAPTTSANCVATGTFSDGSSQVITNIVTWTSSAPNVASVNRGGKVTAQSHGDATITAQLGSLSANCAIVVDGSPVTSIQVSPQTASIPQQTKLAFVATGTFADGNTQNLTKSVLWTSSPASVATISNLQATMGEATGHEPGTATITALFGGQLGTATLTVTSATATSLRVSPAATNLEHGGFTQFTALAEFSDGTTRDVTSSVTWTSSNASVAVVTPTGVATSTRSGTTTMTATMNDLSGTAVLMVY
jgi:trimeric autotransporter adhesin